jgi:hypothetical protein
VSFLAETLLNAYITQRSNQKHQTYNIMSWQQVQDELTIDLIGARLLSNLAEGIYNHEAVLREYVQNARDACFDLWEFLDSSDGRKYGNISTDPSNSPITIRILGPDSISIQDVGVGMDEKEVKKSKGIGVTDKHVSPTSAGFRGIGIWAGFQACDRLELVTSKIGVPHRFRLTIDFVDIRKHVKENINIKELLDGRYRIEKEEAHPNDHYTHVKLVGLHGEHLKLADEAEVKRIASHILPCRISPQFEHVKAVQEHLERHVENYREFPIFVGNSEVFREFPAELEAPQCAMLTEGGVEYGCVWYCSGRVSIKAKSPVFRSFQLRIKNIAVGRDGLFDDEDGAQFGISTKLKLSSPAHLNWHVGEIHLTHEKIVPDTPRTSLELNTLSRRAVEAIRGFYEDRIADSRARSAMNTYQQRVASVEKLLAKKENIDSGEAASLYDYLKEQDAATRGAKPKEAVKRKIREYLTTSSNSAKRKGLIKELERLPCINQTETSKSKKTTTETKSAAASKESAKSDGENTSTTADHGELLLSDLCHAIQQLLKDDAELYTKACRSISEVLQKHGLT